MRQLFVAATLSRSEGSLLARTVGDLLVTPSSAADRMQAADFECWAALLRWQRIADPSAT